MYSHHCLQKVRFHDPRVLLEEGLFKSSCDYFLKYLKYIKIIFLKYIKIIFFIF